MKNWNFERLNWLSSFLMIVTKVASEALSDFQIVPWFLIGSNGIPRYHSQRVYLEYQIESRRTSTQSNFCLFCCRPLKIQVGFKFQYHLNSGNFCGKNPLNLFKDCHKIIMTKSLLLDLWPFMTFETDIHYV